MTLRVGDLIKCCGSDDAAETMENLIRQGYGADFVYELDGSRGLWIEIESVPRPRKPLFEERELL